ncbi:hypothetical protein CRUP_012864 [Coryphaenoides rupestris]|nr:hypothetical protein CRUP_012864 [Coryphaenoides rupestris]
MVDFIEIKKPTGVTPTRYTAYTGPQRTPGHTIHRATPYRRPRTPGHSVHRATAYSTGGNTGSVHRATPYTGPHRTGDPVHQATAYTGPQRTAREGTPGECLVWSGALLDQRGPRGAAEGPLCCPPAAPRGLPLRCPNKRLQGGAQCLVWSGVLLDQRGPRGAAEGPLCCLLLPQGPPPPLPNKRLQGGARQTPSSLWDSGRGSRLLLLLRDKDARLRSESRVPPTVPGQDTRRPGSPPGK